MAAKVDIDASLKFSRAALIMQNRYVGDIGDFVKLSLLRALMPGQALGVAWWLFPDEIGNNDGRRIDYLRAPATWRAFDPELFDSFSKIAFSESRSIRDLQVGLPDATFFDELVPVMSPPSARSQNRVAWFNRVKKTLSECNLVFVDPDNGLEPLSYNPTHKVSGKSIALSELKELVVPGRTIIVYHHQTRRKGGHLEEITYWLARIREFARVEAIRSGRYSPRVFFLLNMTDELRQRAELLVRNWHGHLTWHN